MAHYKYDRLSAQDTSFLVFEAGNVLMHVASINVFKSGSLATPEGGVDFQKIKTAVGNILHRIPRYRQKINWIQKNKTAIWVDDAQFKLGYHVRHTSLPKPGSLDQLKTLASRITETKLDRTKPLWEMWVVEGLEDDRFALISKIHHSMIDGESGVDLSQILMSFDPNFYPDEPPVYYPRPTPTKAELWKDEYERWMTLPIQAANNIQKFRQESEDIIGEVKKRATALGETFKQIGSASETPLNGPLGSHRIIDWLEMDLNDVKAVRRSLGCTVNDIVLATAAGAIRQFFENRQVHPESIPFRVAAPVSVRREEEKGEMGNRVSSWSVKLPIDEADPLLQLQRIYEVTQDLKESNSALGVDMMMTLMDWAPSLISLGARAGGASNNTIITNVPGPQVPMYFLGAEMESIFPMVPLMEGMGIGIALFSYNGKICWGFNADYGRVSDVGSFVRCVKESFERLATAAGVKLGENKTLPAQKKDASPTRKKRVRKASSSKTATSKASKVTEAAPVETTAQTSSDEGSSAKKSNS